MLNYISVSLNFLLPSNQVSNCSPVISLAFLLSQDQFVQDRTPSLPSSLCTLSLSVDNVIICSAEQAHGLGFMTLPCSRCSSYQSSIGLYYSPHLHPKALLLKLLMLLVEHIASHTPFVHILFTPGSRTHFLSLYL